MRLFLLVALTMIAFAANSVLNRMALAGGGIDAIAFGAIRLVAGAVMLGALCLVLRGKIRLGSAHRAAGVAALLLYLFGFSYAYEALDAGLGALVLFGMVQITMFAGGLIVGEAMPRRRWIGAALAMAGLIWLLLPGWDGHPIRATINLLQIDGKENIQGDALQDTGANFVIAALICALPGLWLGEIATGGPGLEGVLLAVICGAVTSGLGYALWYSVLPQLQASVAAVAQLTVPVIAMVGGMMFLGEVLTIQVIMASILVLGGVAVSVLRYSRTKTSKGS